MESSLLVGRGLSVPRCLRNSRGYEFRNRFSDVRSLSVYRNAKFMKFREILWTTLKLFKNVERRMYLNWEIDKDETQ